MNVKKLQYRYDTPPLSEYIRKLISIVICTLEAEFHICNTKMPPAKIELEPISEGSSDEDDLEGDSSAEKLLHRPETLSVISSQTITVVDVSEGKLEAITEEGADEMKERKSRLRRRYKKIRRTMVRFHKSVELYMSVYGNARSVAVFCTVTVGGGVVVDRSKYRCGYCNEMLESFDEETLSLCMIALETFIHREAAMAAPLLFRIISTVSR
ncbi:unnamed protein product [Gongylonema pulchrum]|uniref:E3 ubiquitin-protein ligase E3D n=1 Tax=Gongylonema pulchrum TaxID=637853 RepID=A0A183EQ29_9BILA|nr:unnamed protein product [Gongylonema pulchrum]